MQGKCERGKPPSRGDAKTGSPWASFYPVRIVGAGPRALMILMPTSVSARAPAPTIRTMVEGRKEDCIWGAASWAGLRVGALVRYEIERNHRRRQTMTLGEHRHGTKPGTGRPDPRDHWGGD